MRNRETMEKIRLTEGMWVVVCDGRKLLILENVGDADFPNLKTRAADEHFVPPTHELGSDAPSRVHQSVGTARSSVEQTDWHEIAEERFAATVATKLNAAALENRFEKLILVAPPHSLAALRKNLDAKATQRIVAEIDT